MIRTLKFALRYDPANSRALATTLPSKTLLPHPTRRRTRPLVIPLHAPNSCASRPRTRSSVLSEDRPPRHTARSPWLQREFAALPAAHAQPERPSPPANGTDTPANPDPSKAGGRTERCNQPRPHRPPPSPQPTTPSCGRATVAEFGAKSATKPDPTRPPRFFLTVEP